MTRSDGTQDMDGTRFRDRVPYIRHLTLAGTPYEATSRQATKRFVPDSGTGTTSCTGAGAGSATGAGEGRLTKGDFTRSTEGNDEQSIRGEQWLKQQFGCGTFQFLVSLPDENRSKITVYDTRPPRLPIVPFAPDSGAGATCCTGAGEGSITGAGEGRDTHKRDSQDIDNCMVSVATGANSV